MDVDKKKLENFQKDEAMGNLPENLPTNEELIERANEIEKNLQADEVENKSAVVAPEENKNLNKVEEKEVAQNLKSENLKTIEKILSEDLENLYKNLPENRKVEFRQEGEMAARQIEKQLFGDNFAVAKIIKIIAIWLKMIPDVNKFFLDQTTKIKVDELLKMKEKK